MKKELELYYGAYTEMQNAVTMLQQLKIQLN